jgi:hypothetical protein
LIQLIASLYGQQFLNTDFFSKFTLKKILTASGLHSTIVKQYIYDEVGESVYTYAFPIHKIEEQEWYS